MRPIRELPFFCMRQVTESARASSGAPASTVDASNQKLTADAWSDTRSRWVIDDNRSTCLYKTPVAPPRQLQRRAIRTFNSQSKATSLIRLRQHGHHPRPRRKMPPPHFGPGHSQRNSDEIFSLPQDVERDHSFIHVNADSSRSIAKSHTGDRGPWRFRDNAKSVNGRYCSISDIGSTLQKSDLISIGIQNLQLHFLCGVRKKKLDRSGNVDLLYRPAPNKHAGTQLSQRSLNAHIRRVRACHDSANRQGNLLTTDSAVAHTTVS